VSLNRNHVFGAGRVGLVVRCAHLLVDHHLGDPSAVAQVEKDQTAVVAPPVHPAHQDHILPRVFHAKLPTHLRPLQTTQKV
jgi:hypothetical protein